MAQISAVGLVALAGLLAAMPASEPDLPGVPTAGGPGPTTTPGPPAAGNPEGPSYEVALAAMQSRVAKSEIKAPPPVPDDLGNDTPGDEGGDPVDPPPAVEDNGPPHFRYVGMVSSPRRSYAFVVEPDGTSRMLVAGEPYDRVGDWIVLGMTPERLIISDCDDVNRHEYMVSERPESPSESVIDLGAGVPGSSVTDKAAAGDRTNPAEAGRVYVPPGITDPNERERIESKMREIEDRRKEALKNNNIPTPQPAPSRPATLPPTRPTTTPSKSPSPATNKKDAK